MFPQRVRARGVNGNRMVLRIASLTGSDAVVGSFGFRAEIVDPCAHARVQFRPLFWARDRSRE